MYQKLTPQERIAARFIPSGFTEYKRAGESVVYASPDHLQAIAYRGKAARAEWFYRFNSENGFLSTVTRFFESIAAHEEVINKRKKEKAEFTTALKPGSILCTSWGYDQTNVEFFQVIEVTGRCTVVIREICPKCSNQYIKSLFVCVKVRAWSKKFIKIGYECPTCGIVRTRYVGDP